METKTQGDLCACGRPALTKCGHDEWIAVCGAPTCGLHGAGGQYPDAKLCQRHGTSASNVEAARPALADRERGQVPISRFGEAVDLANGFAGCWTHDGTESEVNEWARQLHGELTILLKAYEAGDA